MDDEFQKTKTVITAAIETVRVAERLRSTIVTLKPVKEALADLNDLDPELAPEILVALGHLEELLDTLGRAQTFVDARFDNVAS